MPEILKVDEITNSELEYKPLDCAKEILNEFNYKTYLNILDILHTNDRCAVVQPTGTGKSYIMMTMLRHFKNTQKIVVAPSPDFLNTLKTNKYWEFKEEIGTECEVNTFTYAKLCRNRSQIDIMMHSHKINPENVSLIVLDELHRLGADEWSEAINRLLNLCPNAKILGLTATPKRYKEHRNMVSEVFNNNLACNINLADAVNLGMLQKLNYVVGISDKYKQTEGTLKTISLNEDIANYTEKMYADYIEKWNFNKYFESTLKKYIDTSIKVGKFIVFVNSLEEAVESEKYIKKAFNSIYKTNKVKVYQCNYKENKSKNNIKEFFKPHIDEYNSKNQLKPDIRVIIAINMLSESYHDEHIKAIIMLNRTQSLNIYLQQIGRIFNASKSNKDFVPTVFDFVDSLNSLDKLKEDILKSSLSNTDGDSKYHCVFEHYYNETVKFKKDTSKIEALSEINSPETHKLVTDTLNKYNVNCIYDIEQFKEIYEKIELEEKTKKVPNNTKELDNELLIKYITAVIKTGVYNDSLDNTENKLECTSSYDDYNTFNSEIVAFLGYEWYKVYKKYTNDKKSLTKEEKSILSSRFNKSIALGQLSDSTLSILKSNGLNTSILDDKNRLYSLLTKKMDRMNCFNKKESASDKLQSDSVTICKRVIELYNSFNTEAYYTTYKNRICIADYYSKHPVIKMKNQSIHTALAYWLWKTIERDNKELLETIDTEVSSYFKLKLLRRNSQKRLLEEPEVVFLADKVLSPFYNLENISDIGNLKDNNTQNYTHIQLKFLANMLDIDNLFNSMDKLYNLILNSTGLISLEESLNNFMVNLVISPTIDFDTLPKLLYKLEDYRDRIIRIN